MSFWHNAAATLKIATSLSQAEGKAQLRRKPMTPGARQALLATECKGKLSKLETRFREVLVAKHLFKQNSLPQSRHPPVAAEVAPSQASASHDVLHSMHIKSDCLQVGDDQNMTLSAEHVFDRLCITGVGKEVMALVDNVVAGHAGLVKAEPFIDDDTEPGAQPICERVWCPAKLRSLALPYAEVEIVRDGSDELKSAGTKSHRVTVHVDNLRPSTCKEEPPKSKQELHPILQEGGNALKPYDYDLFDRPFFQCLAEHASLWAYISTQTSVERVSVSRLSAKGKLPFVLQCRAEEPFKKGQLMLVPALGVIIPNEDDDYAPPKHK